MKHFRYYTNCISCGDSDAINEMKDGAKQVTLSTIRRHCSDFNELVSILGYNKKFPISKDYHVSFWKSKYKDKCCYYLEWSRIEYIFIESH